jgi:hypothetical protein
MFQCFLIEVAFDSVPSAIDSIVSAAMPQAVYFVYVDARKECYPGVFIECSFSVDDYLLSPEEAIRHICDRLTEEILRNSTNRVVSMRAIILEEDEWFLNLFRAPQARRAEPAHDRASSARCISSRNETQLATRNLALTSRKLHPCSSACQIQQPLRGSHAV